MLTKIIIISAMILVGVGFSSSYAIDEYEIPGWIKNMASFWVDGVTTDQEFAESIEFLIENEHLEIPKISELENEIKKLEFENSRLKEGGRPAVGKLWEEHEHAAILVVVHGQKLDFSLEPFQSKSPWIHFEGGNGEIIHRHAAGITLGFLFDTIDINLNDECISYKESTEFCSDETNTLQFFINGEQINSIRNYEIKEGDKILITYGNYDKELINKQLEILNSYFTDRLHSSV